MTTPTSIPAGVYLDHAEKLIRAMAPGSKFVNADVHARMRAAKWPELDEPRRFGGLSVRLKHAGLIEKVGVESSPSRSHSGVASVWRRTHLAQETTA